MNYRDTDGHWQKIDDTLVSDGDGWVNRADAFHVHLPQAAGGAIVLATRAGTTTVSLRGATGGGAAVGAQVDYRQALPSVSVSDAVSPTGLKETLRLGSSAAPGEFRYRLGLPTGSHLVQAADGSLLVVNDAGATVATLPAPVARDSAPTAAYSTAPVSYRIDGSSSAPVVILAVARSWLNDPTRVFPVLVDPTVTVRDSGDTYVEGGSDASTNYDGVSPMCLGYDASAAAYQRVLLKFDIADNFNTYMQVLNAHLKLYVTSNTGSVSVTTAGLDQAFTPSQATWNQAATGTAWANPGGDTVSNGPTTTDTISTSGDWMGVYPTALVSKWVTGDYNDKSNNGADASMLLKASSESTTAGQLCVADNADPNGHAPQLIVHWQSFGGDRADNTYRSYQIDDKETLKVNVVTGAVLLEATDDTVNGVGLNFVAARTYNSGANPYNLDSYLGLNWELSPSPNISLQAWSDGSLTYFTPTGGAYTFTPKAGGGFSSPPGIHATLSYDAANNKYTLTANGDGLKQVFSPHTMTSMSDRNGNSITINDPDADDDIDTWTDTESRTFATTYWASGAGFGYLENITDPASRSTTYNYTTATDGSTLLTSYVDPTGQTTSYGYNVNDLLDSITSPGGRSITITYAFNNGTSGPVAEVCRTDSHSGTTPCEDFSTDWSTHDATVTDANGHDTTYRFEPDEMKVTKTTDALGNHRSTGWSGDDMPQTLADNTTDVYTLGYDNLNNLSTIQSATGGTAQFNYTNSLHPYAPSSASDPQGNCTSFSYDNAGNLTAADPGQGKNSTGDGCDGSGGLTLTNTYQGGGASCGGKTGELCKTTDGRSHTTNYSYDTHGNLSSIAPPSPLGSSTIVINASTNLLTSVTDGKSQKTSYFYDHLGRITEIGFGGYTTSPCTSTAAAAGSCIGYAYDHDGNLTSRVDNTGTTTFAYDGLNRIYSETFPDTTTSTVDYDGVGNVTSYTDAGGTVTYRYDSANNPWALAEPGGSCPSYPTAPSFPNATKCVGFTYNDSSERTKVDFPSGETVLLCYDDSHRQTLVAAYRPSVSAGTCSAPGSSPFVKRGYAYDRSGVDTALRTKVTDESGTSTFYGYDSLNRLCWVGTASFASCGSSTSRSYGYSYDDAGNITQVNTAGSATVYNGYNNADELCWSGTTNGTAPNGGSACTANPGPTGDSDYLYDADGNLCWTAGSTGSTNTCSSPPTGATGYTYNAKNQTTGIGTNTFSYADVGQTQRATSNSLSYLNGLLGLSGRSDGEYWTRDPAGGLIDMRQGAGSSFTANYYTLDAQASVLAATDANGTTDTARYTYDPYGTTLTATGSQSDQVWRYASGYYQSVTGLTKYGDRYYNPTHARWTQRDPITGAIADPGTMNRYTYAGDNPVNNTDPTGQFSWGGFFEGVGVGIGIASAFLPPGFDLLGGAIAATVSTAGAAAEGCSGRDLATTAAINVLGLNAGGIAGGFGATEAVSRLSAGLGLSTSGAFSGFAAC